MDLGTMQLSIAAEELARIRATYPQWSIRLAGTGYSARRTNPVRTILASSLQDLEAKLIAAC
jgi:hypothetical protein